MNISAVIIEDEKLTAERLKKLLVELTDVTILSHLSSVKNAKAWFNKNPLPDILFLDIHLGDGTGFDFLESIEGFPHVIFTTAYDKYSIEAFQYNSIDYLLKPIKPKELIKAIAKFDKLHHSSLHLATFEKLKFQLDKKYKNRFLFKLGSRYVQIPTANIAYFYSHDGLNYTRCKSGETHITDLKMDELESMLDPSLFFRINRGILVGVDQIKEIHSYFNGRLLLELIPSYDFGEVLVSREKVKSFKDWLDG